MNQPAQQQGQRPAAPTLGRADYSSWRSRVLAAIIDAVPYAVIVGIGIGTEVGTRETLCASNTSPYDIAPYCATGNSAGGVAALVSSLVIGLLYLIWNYGYRQGRTGSSIGKSVLKFRVVSDKTRQPVGFGRSVVRQLAHVIDAIICYVGFLFPLWDARRQTLADKVMKTVCLPHRLTTFDRGGRAR